MKKINTISGGKTSAFISANYKSNYNVFALVRVDDKKCLFPDKKIRQIVEDKIQKPFIGTLEDNTIIYTILDLEQFIGKKIHWVSGITFDEVVKTKGGWLPNKLHRYCTTHLKMQPLFKWWQKTINKPSEFRIGFRANEQSRAKNTLSKTNKNGFLEMKTIIGKRGSRNKWGLVEWQKPVFPLIENNIFKDQIESYWKGKPVRFAWMNNCVGCFHKTPLLLKKMYQLHPNKMEWFEKQELNRNPRDGWKNHQRYKDIKNINLQFELFETDFNDCDSGYCGI